MTEQRYVIPEQIRDAVHNALASYPVAANTGHAAEIACEAFAKALSENPIVPTDEQAEEIYKRCYDSSGLYKAETKAICSEFQRDYMFR